MKKQLLFLLIILSALSTNAQSVSIYRAGVLTSPTYLTIKEAVAASLDKDSLVLSADTFKENMVVIDKNLSITGIETSSIKSTIDATHDSTALIFTNIDPSVTLTLIIQHTDIINGMAYNGTDKGGGAICADNNTILIIGDSSILSHNEASNLSPNGGAIFSLGQVDILSNARIENNTAAGSGGGIYTEKGMTMDGAAYISNNHALENGGGIYFSGTAIIRTSFITKNTAQMGGGVYANNGELYFLNNAQIKANASKNQGGGIALINCHFTLKDSVSIIENSTDTNFGAGIYAKGNHDIYISGGQIVGNHSTNPSSNGLGMAIYNDSADGGSSVIFLNSARIFNPKTDNSRQNEIFNAHKVSSFLSDSTWWGQSDTSKLIWNLPPRTYSLRTWTVVDWSVNGGTPVGASPSFPVEAYFRLNTGGKLPPKFHWMLQGVFLCDSGTFDTNVPEMNTANIVGTTFKVPYTSYSVKMQASVDADTFRKSVWVLGLSINEQGMNSSIKFNVYPNPSNGQMTITASEKTTESFTAKVFDLLGRVVFEKDLEQNSSTNELYINTSAGYYILELKDKTGHVWREKIQIK